MPRNTLLIAAGAVVLAVVLAGGFYWRWSTSPRYALQQMALALEAQDMQKFFKYINLKDLFNSVLEGADGDTPAPDDPKADEWTRFTRSLGKKFHQKIIGKLLVGLEDPIRRGLEKYLLNLDQKQILGIVAAATMAEIDTRGEMAQVTLKDSKTQDMIRLQMRRQSDSGTWQIVAVNYQDLKKLIRKEFLQ